MDAVRPGSVCPSDAEIARFADAIRGLDKRREAGREQRSRLPAEPAA